MGDNAEHGLASLAPPSFNESFNDTNNATNNNAGIEHAMNESLMVTLPGAFHVTPRTPPSQEAPHNNNVNVGSDEEHQDNNVDASEINGGIEDPPTHVVGEAYLVEEGGSDAIVEHAVEAKPVSLSERKWKFIVVCLISLLVVFLAVILPLTLMNKNDTPSDALGSSMGNEDTNFCSPCINRGDYTVKVMVHSASDDDNNDSYWDTFSASAQRAGSDMGVNLDLQLYGEEKQMVKDIRATVSPNSGIDALVVNIPSRTVATAVRYAAGKGMPIFGVDSGLDLAKSSGGLIDDKSLLFFSSPDEHYAGRMAASFFLDAFSDSDKEIDDALFLTPFGIRDNSTQWKRFDGYQGSLLNTNSTVRVKWVEVKEPYISSLRDILSDYCKYQSILIGSDSGGVAKDVVNVLTENDCHQTKVGTFGISPEIEQMVKTNRLDFAIDRNAYLQGWSAAVFAAMFVTTGLVTIPPPSSAYLAGPLFYTKENFTSDTAQMVSNVDYSRNITIAGVIHDTMEESKVWDPAFIAAAEAANDMDINLIFERMELDTNIPAPYESYFEPMAKKIRMLCERGLDGLFVTLVDDIVIDAVRDCQEMDPGIKIVSLEVGYEASRQLNLLHHVGVMEGSDSGYQAGQKMLSMADMNKALCVNYAPGYKVLDDRCSGFGQSMNASSVDYYAVNDPLSFPNGVNASLIESILGSDGDWSGYGILLLTEALLPSAIELKKNHSNVVLGSFDTLPTIYDALENGDVLFGIDRQLYLLYYLPITLLTHATLIGQSFSDHLIRTGPNFVTIPPSNEESKCAVSNFPVCP